MTEQQIQKKITTYLESLGAYTVKVISASRSGVPDILCCYQGYFIGIEVKKPTTLNTVSKLQEYNIKKIQQAEGYAIVASCVEDVEKLLKELP